MASLSLRCVCGVCVSDNPLESEFMGKLKAIEGTSLHETQEITFVKM